MKSATFGWRFFMVRLAWFPILSNMALIGYVLWHSLAMSGVVFGAFTQVSLGIICARK